MTWPWVSRRAYDEVCRQRDRMEAREAEIVDQLVRMSRVSQGMTEIKPTIKPPDPMPDALTRLIGGFSSSGVQAQMTEQCLKQRRLGETWENIERFIRDSLGVE
jgi:hypothetical protein